MHARTGSWVSTSVTTKGIHRRSCKTKRPTSRRVRHVSRPILKLLICVSLSRDLYDEGDDQMWHALLFSPRVRRLARCSPPDSRGLDREGTCSRVGCQRETLHRLFQRWAELRPVALKRAPKAGEDGGHRRAVCARHATEERHRARATDELPDAPLAVELFWIGLPQQAARDTC